MGPSQRFIVVVRHLDHSSIRHKALFVPADRREHTDLPGTDRLDHPCRR